MNTGKEEDSPWDHIDAIPVINLDIRPERWDRFRETTAGKLPKEKLVRFPASLGVALPGYGEAPWFSGKSTDPRWGGRAGCTLSHQRTMEMAVEKGWKIMLILEDDAEFAQVGKEELTGVLRKLFSDFPDWDICYLGFSKTSGPSRLIGHVGDHGIFRISGAATTHAYLVNSKARDWILKRFPTQDRIWHWTAMHRICDRWYAMNLSRKLKVLAVSPSLITQMTGFSDLVQQEVDYKTDFPGKVTHVPVSSLGFYMGRLWWRIQGITTLAHDSIRYLIKRVKGF